MIFIENSVLPTAWARPLPDNVETAQSPDFSPSAPMNWNANCEHNIGAWPRPRIHNPVENLPHKGTITPAFKMVEFWNKINWF